MHENTPLASPDMNNRVEDDEMIFIEDVEEVIEDYDTTDVQEEETMEEETMEEDAPREGDEICSFTRHTQSVFCGSLTKDGKLAATGEGAEQAYVWDTSTGKIVLHCTGHKDTVIFSAFNHNESYLATGDMCGMIQIWRMADKEKIFHYITGDITWMMWHPAANVLLAATVDGMIYMWKIPKGDCKTSQGYGCRAETAAMFPDGKRLAVGYEDGIIRVLDLKTSTVLSTISSNLGHTSTVITIDCHLDNNLIISAAVDGKTIISTAKTGKIVSVLQSLNGNDETLGNSEAVREINWVESVVFCKDPAFPVAATGTIDGEIFIWDIAKQDLRHKIVQESGIVKLVWRGKTSILFSAALDGVLRCFDAKSGQCLRCFSCHTANIIDLCIAENAAKALTTSEDFTAKIIDISSIP